MFANGPPWTKAGVPSVVWTRLGWMASFRSTVIAPATPRSFTVKGVPSNLGGGNVETGLSGYAVGTRPETCDYIPERTVIHIQNPFPQYLLQGKTFLLMLIQIIVQHGRNHIVCGSHRVEVPCKMEIYPVHRHYLGITSACGTSLETETRAERRLTESHYRLSAYTVEPQGKSDRDRSLADTCLGSRNSCHKNKPVFPGLFIICQRLRNLCHIMTIRLDHFLRYPGLGRHLGDFLHPYASGDFYVRFHTPPLILRTACGAPLSLHRHLLPLPRNRT